MARAGRLLDLLPWSLKKCVQAENKEELLQLSPGPLEREVVQVTIWKRL